MTRLRELARAPEAVAASAEERCDLCGEPVAPGHRHLIEVRDRRLLCVCRPCSILFDHPGAGGARYRLVPDRARRLDDVDLDDALWSSLGIPVDLAFFFRSSAGGRVAAFYPAPAGATESLLRLDAWEELVARNPALARLEPDVEALLVDRTHGARRYWLVPVDRCYELVGLIRLHWRGFAGGAAVWQEVEAFFERLER